MKYVKCLNGVKVGYASDFRVNLILSNSKL